jgi:hypothetical protein
MEDYYKRFLRLCAIIRQRPYDIYLKETFREGPPTKVKMVIISMRMKTLSEVVQSIILVKELPMKR